jgi:hypothetical protein
MLAENVPLPLPFRVTVVIFGSNAELRPALTEVD